jgi:hypothetical protein
MRFRLRTLLIVLAFGPPAIAAGWFYAFDLSASERATIGALLLSAEIVLISLTAIGLTIIKIADTRR